MDQIMSLAVLAITPIAIVLILYILITERNGIFSYLGYRIGLAFAICSLIGQLSRAWFFWEANNPYFNELHSRTPWWVNGDFGYLILGASFLWNQKRLKK